MESQVTKLEWKWSHIFVALSLILLAAGCGGRAIVSPGSRPAVPERRLTRIGYSIQIGAFSNLDNAVRLTKSLESHRLNAYYFVHKTGLYKVRFGDFPSKETARRKADSILAEGYVGKQTGPVKEGALITYEGSGLRQCSNNAKNLLGIEMRRAHF